MNKKQLKAVEKLKKAFPLLEVGVDCDDGLLVILTNADCNENKLVKYFGEYATIERV